jgi:hypothetical protein
MRMVLSTSKGLLYLPLLEKGSGRYIMGRFAIKLFTVLRIFEMKWDPFSKPSLSRIVGVHNPSPTTHMRGISRVKSLYLSALHVFCSNDTLLTHSKYLGQELWCGWNRMTRRLVWGAVKLCSRDYLDGQNQEVRLNITYVTILLSVSIGRSMSDLEDPRFMTIAVPGH